VIAAHAIQRQGALAEIMDETGHCLTFYPPTGHEQSEPQRRGWREASTFTGFCDRHDSKTFAPLETRAFIGTPEQGFLLAYRAECHELYQKQASDRSHNPLRQIADRGMSREDQEQVQALHAVVGEGVKKGLHDSRHYKGLMDAELLAASFDAYSTLFVQFEGEIGIAGTGAPTPNRSFAGEELCALHDPTTLIPRLYVGLVPAERGGAAVFVWRKGESGPERFMTDLRGLSWGVIPGVVVQFILAYIENTYFSAAWWRSLDDREKLHVRSLATMGNPYYTTWSYRDLRVPWKIVSISDRWRSSP